MKRLISTLLLAALLCGCLVSGALAGSDDALEQFGSIADTICGLDGPPSDEQLSALLADLEALDFDAAEEDNGLTGSMVGDSTNVQMLFYKLQLELAQQAKESAQETIEQIQQQNEKQRLCSQFINEARTTVSNLSGDKTVAVPEDMLDFLQENLSAGYRVDTASDGEEGWRKVLSSLPDIVVSDVLMPGMDGIQLLKELKRNPNTNHIPVILLTSQVEFADRMAGLTQGADGYLGKPFRLEELDVLISNLIANRLRLKGKFSGSQAQEGMVAPVELPNSDKALMDRIMKVINENLGNSKLNVEMLAKETGMSRTQLHRRIKDLTGMTAADFIRNLRLRQAARLLKAEKGLTVTEIAYAVGFTSQTHFSTLFKKQYGKTPTEYMDAANHKPL